MAAARRRTVWKMSVRRLVYAAVIAVGAVVAGVVLAGFLLAAPQRAMVNAPPPDLNVIAVQFPSASGATLRGWFLPGEPGRGAVVLMHGVYNNRSSMLERARLLAERGCAVLLFDFQAEGESTGDRITFGQLESFDARAGVDYVRRRLPGEKVAIIGVSLGGAAALLASEPLPVDAMVLESVFPDLHSAVANRLHAYLGPIGTLVTPLFEILLPPIFGLNLRDLRPIERMDALTMPVLIASGTLDDRTPLAEARAMFDRVRAPKTFWAVVGARHVDLESYAPEDYRRIVLPFVIDHIRGMPEPLGSGAK